MAKALGFTPDYLTAGTLGQAKKVVATSGGNVELIGSTSAPVGIFVRVMSNTGSTMVMLGDTNMTADSSTSPGAINMTADSSTSPGAIIIVGAQSGLAINLSGAIYARTDAGTATIAVAPILSHGLASELIS